MSILMASKKTAREQDAFDRRVFRLITGCTGMTVASISRKLDCDWHTVDRSVKRLLLSGKIKCVENSKNLKIYENAERPLDPYGTLADGLSSDETDAYSPPMTTAHEMTKDCHFDKTTRSHISGCYTVDIKKGGKIEPTIRDKQGFTIGHWNIEPRRLKNALYYKGAIQVQREYIQFQANQNSRGEWTMLSVYPNPRRIYYANAVAHAHIVMNEQVEIVTKILSEDGWEFSGEPILKGTMHYGEVAPELLRYAGRSFREDCDRASLHADHSVPEGELEIYEDSVDPEKTQEHINVIFDLPERLLSMENNLVHLYHILDKMERIHEKNAEMNQSLLENIQLQTSILAELGISRGKDAMAYKTNDDRTGYQ